jgi:phosphoribosylanthranilate isomerase (EC 5.3.1.24)
VKIWNRPYICFIPWAVDLSSSVETDGHKDPDKILEAVYAVRNIKEEI